MNLDSPRAPLHSTSLRVAVAMFAAFAFAYFLSALLRAVTATLAPAFSAELGLSAGDLGLLAGAYFLGFALMQLPLGRALDRWGPRRVLLIFLSVAVVACMAFAVARSYGALLAARAMIGVGVSACLMAPLTAYRLRLGPAAQLRANSWMLMSGSLGMVASTLPVQWLLPTLGWRGLFWWVAGLLAVATALIAWIVPRDIPQVESHESVRFGYSAIVRHPEFVRLAPLAFFVYGGFIAVQALWAGPWLTDVAGQDPVMASRGLFAINLCMLFAFFAWGLAMPKLARRGWRVEQMLIFGLPLSTLLLLGAVVLGARAGAAWWAAWCVACSVVSLSQPALALAYPAAVAGRALSAYNLVIFLGVFCIQWGIGLMIDSLVALGWQRITAFQASFALLALGGGLSYAWFVWRGPKLPPQAG